MREDRENVFLLLAPVFSLICPSPCYKQRRTSRGKTGLLPLLLLSVFFDHSSCLTLRMTALRGGREGSLHERTDGMGRSLSGVRVTTSGREDGMVYPRTGLFQGTSGVLPR